MYLDSFASKSYTKPGTSQLPEITWPWRTCTAWLIAMAPVWLQALCGGREPQIIQAIRLLYSNPWWLGGGVPAFEETSISGYVCAEGMWFSNLGIGVTRRNLSHLLAGIGTLCFALMLVPQVVLNTRRRSTEGRDSHGKWWCSLGMVRLETERGLRDLWKWMALVKGRNSRLIRLPSPTGSIIISMIISGRTSSIHLGKNQVCSIPQSVHVHFRWVAFKPWRHLNITGMNPNEVPHQSMLRTCEKVSCGTLFLSKSYVSGGSFLFLGRTLSRFLVEKILGCWSLSLPYKYPIPSHGPSSFSTQEDEPLGKSPGVVHLPTIGLLNTKTRQALRVALWASCFRNKTVSDH